MDLSFHLIKARGLKGEQRSHLKCSQWLFFINCNRSVQSELALVLVSVKSGGVRRREVFSSLLQADVSAVCQVGQVVSHLAGRQMLYYILLIIGHSNDDIKVNLMYGCKQHYCVKYQRGYRMIL